MTQIQLLYNRPDKSVKHYYVISHYFNDYVFYFGNAGCAGWTKLESFVEQVNCGDCKVIVVMVMSTNAIEIIKEAFL